jgi:hypothetical protein
MLHPREGHFAGKMSSPVNLGVENRVPLSQRPMRIDSTIRKFVAELLAFGRARG